MYNTSDFARKADLASLKLDVDNIGINKLKTALTVLNKLSNVADNNVVKKHCIMNWLKRLIALFRKIF